MIFLGQVAFYRKYHTSEPVACMILGKNTNTYLNIAILTLDKKGELVREDTKLDELTFAKEQDDSSPSGLRIYYGKFCTFQLALAPGALIKPPVVKMVKAELEHVGSLQE